MVAEWIAALGATGGAALMSAAATDAWESAREGMITLFGRGGQQRRELAAAWLDEDEDAMRRADDAEREDVRRRALQAWQVRLVDLLCEYPGAADELRTWTTHVQAQVPAPRQAWVQTNNADHHATVLAVQGGAQHVHYYGPAPHADDSGQSRSDPARDR